jgi:hypothetical protein
MPAWSSDSRPFRPRLLPRQWYIPIQAFGLAPSLLVFKIHERRFAELCWYAGDIIPDAETIIGLLSYSES